MSTESRLKNVQFFKKKLSKNDQSIKINIQNKLKPNQESNESFGRMTNIDYLFV